MDVGFRLTGGPSWGKIGIWFLIFSLLTVLSVFCEEIEIHDLLSLVRNFLRFSFGELVGIFRLGWIECVGKDRGYPGSWKCLLHGLSCKEQIWFV